MTKFVAFVTIDMHRGAEAHISVAEQVTTVDGRPIFAVHGDTRGLHSFESAHDTLAEARRWASRRLLAVAEQTTERAANLIAEAEAEEAAHGIV